MKSLENIATRCNKIEVSHDNGQWSCRFHHNSGIVCYGLGDTLANAIDAAEIHGRTRARELKQKNWVF